MLHVILKVTVVHKVDEELDSEVRRYELPAFCQIFSSARQVSGQRVKDFTGIEECNKVPEQLAEALFGSLSFVADITMDQRSFTLTSTEWGFDANIDATVMRCVMDVVSETMTCALLFANLVLLRER
ncbi:MAG: hypothetical protein M3Q81_00780 [bacterium]|nr:hypothetical protein [bacterium]